MDNFLPRRRPGEQGVAPSKSAAAHTTQNLQTIKPSGESGDSKVTVSEGHHLQAGKKPRRSFKEWLKSLTKKQWIIIGIVAALVLAGIGTGLYFWLRPDKKVTQAEVVEEVPPPAPTTVASNLTGLQVEPAVNERAVTAVMIENSTDARPQSGLSQAGVVFEAIAEGGITRFIAMYQDTEPDFIGPVRSVRPYYIQWALGFDAPIAHVGGSPEALAKMKEWGAKDLDQFAGSAYFERIPSRTAPHNVYTSIAKLHEYEAKKGYGKSVYTSLPRTNAEAPNATPTAKTINLNISSSTYNVQYTYDPATNTYLRNEGGAAHSDQQTGRQLAPKVVVALVMPQGADGKYTTYNTIGSGQVSVFQNGIEQKGTWKKESNNANFTFTDQGGAELKLIPGQTWFTVVGSADRITSAP